MKKGELLYLRSDIFGQANALRKSLSGPAADEAEGDSRAVRVREVHEAVCNLLNRSVTSQDDEQC